VIADTREAVGDQCAIAVRMAVDELIGDAGLQHDAEAKDIIEALADEPDLWDVNLSDWSNDSQSARFSEEGYQEPYTAFVKSVTTKPVVGVGRYTSPDTMVRLINSGHLDFIGAARPSIADPFLPVKIEQGRSEDIRECIGCNICITGDNTNVPMRCTQNPTVGEEWRRGWHPEKVNKIKTQERCLVVGGGPAGLEAARVLAERGFEVTLADAAEEWGGRVTTESRLPGLSSWSRVRDWRVQQLQRMSNVSMYLQNDLSATDVLEFDAEHIAIATGAQWRNDGVGRASRVALSCWQSDVVLGVDALLADAVDFSGVNGPVVVYDDDRFYMASALAEKIVQAGRPCVFVTPSAVVAPWTEKTLEQVRIQKRLLELGVQVVTGHEVVDLHTEVLTVACVYSGQTQEIPATAIVPVTARLPNDALWQAIIALENDWAAANVRSVQRIGDCYAPALIANAVHSGHAYGRAVGLEEELRVRREDNLQSVLL